VKSQLGFHLGLQSLTPHSFVSIKTLEHCAGFGFEVFCILCAQLSLLFYCVAANITFPREAGKTSSDSTVFILADIVVKVYC